MCIGDVRPCFFHEIPFPGSCGPGDSTESSSSLMATDLAGQNMILKDLELVNEGNTCSPLFLH